MTNFTLDTGKFIQLVRRVVKGTVSQRLTAREVKLKEVCAAFGPERIALFDADFYRERNADIARSGIDPFWHFLNVGWREGRSPSRYFDVAHYLAKYEDVRTQDINPLMHYVDAGHEEGRDRGGEQASADLSAALKSAFDRDYYLKTYPDVASSGQDPMRHYLESGWRENRNPSPHFNTQYYLNTYDEVSGSGLDPLSHYLLRGSKQGYVAQRTVVLGSGSMNDDEGEDGYSDGSELNFDSLPLHELGFAGLKGAGLFVTSTENGLIRGVAYNPTTEMTEVEIMIGNKVVASSDCLRQTPLGEKVGLPLRSGFRANIPLLTRYTNPNSTGIRFKGKPGTARQIDWRTRIHPRAVFIANATNKNDGSRIYRADLPALQLRNSGVDAQVIGQEDAFSDILSGQFHPEHCDVVIFQRVPEISSSLNMLDLAKKKNCRVLYDVDDLMFKPWRRAEMGVIRSGQIKFEDANYAESLRKRLNLLSQCDGVICSTPFLQRELNSLGVPVILSRNAVDDLNFTHGARRLAQPAGEGFKLMFMSGTPTHGADFAQIKDILKDILIRNPSVTLTILGELQTRDLDYLPNVVRIPAVPRMRMFEIIAGQDLVIVPLERTPFNAAKSSLKFMECGAAGVPIIASDLFEFERDVRRSDAGMIARDAEDWRMSLQRYIDAPALSREHGLKAFRYCLDNYSVRSRGDYLWNEICRLDECLAQQAVYADNTNRKFRQTV